jgi:hypothetical protein
MLPAAASSYTSTAAADLADQLPLAPSFDLATKQKNL